MRFHVEKGNILGWTPSQDLGKSDPLLDGDLTNHPDMFRGDNL